MSKNDGGSAFPGGKISHYEYEWVGPNQVPTGKPVMVKEAGMTLRDYFAAHAIDVGSRSLTMDDCMDYDARKANIARHAYEMADAMLKEREK